MWRRLTRGLRRLRVLGYPAYVIGPAVLAWVGMAIVISQATSNQAWVVVYAESVVLVAVLLFAADMARGSSSVQARALDQVMAGMVSLAAYVYFDPLQDHRHHYTEVEEEYVVAGQDGTYSWNLSGYNASEEFSDALILKFGGDSPVDPGQLQVQARDRATSVFLPTTIVRDEPFVKAVRVSFPKPLAPGDGFGLRISVAWPNTFPRSRSHDYVFFVFGQYAATPVDRLTCRLICDVPVKDAQIFTPGGDGLVSTGRPPVVIPSPGYNVVEWIVTDADKLYVMRFRKSSRHESAS